MCPWTDQNINLKIIQCISSQLLFHKGQINLIVVAALLDPNSRLTLNRAGSALSSLTRMDSPMRVAMLQCGMVGVKNTVTVLSESFTSM